MWADAAQKQTHGNIMENVLVYQKELSGGRVWHKGARQRLIFTACEKNSVGVEGTQFEVRGAFCTTALSVKRGREISNAGCKVKPTRGKGEGKIVGGAQKEREDPRKGSEPFRKKFLKLTPTWPLAIDREWAAKLGDTLKLGGGTQIVLGKDGGEKGTKKKGDRGNTGEKRSP